MTFIDNDGLQSSNDQIDDGEDFSISGRLELERGSRGGVANNNPSGKQNKGCC